MASGGHCIHFLDIYVLRGHGFCCFVLCQGEYVHDDERIEARRGSGSGICGQWGI